MKKYECLYIVNINYDSEGTSAVAARVEGVLKNAGAEIANSQSWGKRKLAYAIDKERYGDYILLHFQGENPNVAEIHKELEIESGVLHYMTIRLDEFPDFDSLSVPQAFEIDRKRSTGHGARRPRRYEDDAKPSAPAAAPVADSSDEAKASKEAPEVADDAKAPKEAPEVADDAEVAESVEESAAPEEVVEESTEEVKTEDVETSEEEVEESADKAEKDAEKPADAE